MFFNYLKTAFRNLWQNKTNSFLNIFGLAVGIVCAALIFLWVEDELNFDRFNEKKDRLYFARVNATLTSGVFTHWSTPGVLGPAALAEIPGIANSCRTTEGDTRMLFNIGEKSLYASGKFAEPSLFSMFTLPFLEGNPANPFPQVHSLILTEKTARKFFGDDKKILGRTVRMDNKQDYVISGVIKDIPENSSLRFEWIAPFDIWYQQSPWAQKWENNSISTYMELKPGAQITAVNQRLYDFVQKRAPQSLGHVFLFGMNDWHLYGDFQNGKPTGKGFITYVRLFSTIAWIILVIACINFMNLSTARSDKRAKEVGVRKVMGAGRGRLAMQFIGESLLMATLSMILAVLIMNFILPAFNLLVQKNLSLGLDKPLHLAALFIITITCGLVAGSYPSLYLSSFNPVLVLKSIKLKTGSAAIIRKGLVIGQFAISVILIIATLVIYQQIRYVKSRGLGFDKDKLVEIKMQGDMSKHFESIKQELLHTGLVENVALSDHETIYGGNNTDELAWESKPPGNKVLVSWRDVSVEYMKTSGLKLLDGRDFEITDTVNFEKPPGIVGGIITESLARLMGKGSAIGKRIYSENDSSLHVTVVGVVNDIVYGNMYGKPDPVMFICTAPRFENTMYVRTKTGARPEQIIPALESVIKKNNPVFPFEYRFVDDQFNDMFYNESLVSKLSRVFASLAILISCLGLFGLAAYTAERRTKEIGVRRVLGASISGIAGLLSKDFIRLVVFASIIAFPIAWWMMNNWLQDYEYRISISWWIFIVAGALAIFIALITISSHAIRAAMANPAKSLRTE